MAEIEIDVDADEAVRDVESMQDGLDSGARSTVKQLVVLAEGAMKKEAPEGRGRDKHLRDSIDTRYRNKRQTANVGARKRTDAGFRLASVIVEGTDSTSYDRSNPPPIGPLKEWADAKLGDPSAGYAVRQNIIESGHKTFPNPFVSRSVEDWDSQVEDVAGDKIRDAVRRAMGGQ